MILNKSAIPGLQIAYNSAKCYEDKMWYSFLIKVCLRNTEWWIDASTGIEFNKWKQDHGK